MGTVNNSNNTQHVLICVVDSNNNCRRPSTTCLTMGVVLHCSNIIFRKDKTDKQEKQLERRTKLFYSQTNSYVAIEDWHANKESKQDCTHAVHPLPYKITFTNMELVLNSKERLCNHQSQIHNIGVYMILNRKGGTFLFPFLFNRLSQPLYLQSFLYT